MLYEIHNRMLVQIFLKQLLFLGKDRIDLVEFILFMLNTRDHVFLTIKDYPQNLAACNTISLYVDFGKRQFIGDISTFEFCRSAPYATFTTLLKGKFVHYNIEMKNALILKAIKLPYFIRKYLDEEAIDNRELH